MNNLTRVLSVGLLLLEAQSYFLKGSNTIQGYVDYHGCLCKTWRGRDVTRRKKSTHQGYILQSKKSIKITTHNGKAVAKCTAVRLSKSGEDGNTEWSNDGVEEKNKLIGREFEGITIFPLKQEGEDNDLRTRLPAREFKPKRSLGQNYLNDENIIRKMVNAIEISRGELANPRGKNTHGEKPVKTRKGEKPSKKRKGEKPSKKRKGENPSKKRDAEKPSGQRDAEQPSGQRDAEQPSEQRDAEQPSEQRDAEKPSEQRDAEDTLESLKDKGRGVIELGCGLGQISKFLYKKYENMTGIEIDSRALSVLSRTMPGFDFIHDDVLQVNYKELSISKGTKLTIIGNLPFYITSQILFCLLDFHKYIEQAIVTIQYEVGKRIVAKYNDKNYSILSILFSLYTNSYLLFKIPSKSFYPIPKVEAAVMKIIFTHNNLNCNLLFLKEILRYSFQQRRKKLKSSLKPLLIKYNLQNMIPLSFCDLRPQQLLPQQFVELTNLLFPLHKYPFDPLVETKIWRKKKHGD
ncbi:apicoplast dimethyladenosine synthase, putative [Plasmodium ovale]|uniref:rRNA adenine N(6)-methyltransferase n=1 Tax=Plasmodium ovale TaxID=36330 RepID=A0A1C3L637_PLAOA|nr:apicoplast dimethyladenosine synthase, putative [Plasmodium ovale]